MGTVEGDYYKMDTVLRYGSPVLITVTVLQKSKMNGTFDAGPLSVGGEEGGLHLDVPDPLLVDCPKEFELVLRFVVTEEAVQPHLP